MQDGRLEVQRSWSPRSRMIFYVDSVFSVVYSPDGKTLASGSQDKALRLWDVATGRELRDFEGHTDMVNSVAFSPNGQRLGSGSPDGSIRIHRIDDGVELIALRVLAVKEASYAFTPSGHIDLRGPDACSARQYPICRIGNLVFPFDVCEERFYAPGLLATVHTGDTSYLEPENAPTLMNCPDNPTP